MVADYIKFTTKKGQIKKFDTRCGQSQKHTIGTDSVIHNYTNIDLDENAKNFLLKGYKFVLTPSKISTRNSTTYLENKSETLIKARRL